MNWNPVIEALPYVVVVMAFIMVRLIRVFTTHQQKMAEILNKTNADQAEIAALRKEIADLRTLVNESVIAADDRRRINSPPPVPDLTDRLRSNA